MKNSQNQHARRSQQQQPPHPPVPAAGTPVQQLWQIANFHERRLNRVERAHVENAATLAQQLQASREQEGDGATQSVANELKKLASRIARLEARARAIGVHVADQRGQPRVGRIGRSARLDARGRVDRNLLLRRPGVVPNMVGIKK